MGGSTIVIEGDTIKIGEAVIGKTAAKYITNVQVGAMMAKGVKRV